jgi:hypothetical protein
VHGTRYRVLGPEIPSILLCPCPDFGRRDVGTCKHVEAVRAFLAIHPESEPRPPAGEGEGLWPSIEAAVRRYPPLPLASLRPLWAAGAVLTADAGP